VFGLLSRLLKRRYPNVLYARNITDVDDKINAAAKNAGVPIDTITRRYAQAYREDMARLGADEPDIAPHATAHIAEIIAMCERLIDNGHAYAAENHVLFDVSSFPDYGRLSGRSTDDMIAGARVDVAPYKKNPMDFVLWKPSDANTPGWDSPWGRGRPGWHLECSAMIEATFTGGDTIDIHGGGNDLIFPHHENEIAQSEGAHHEHPLANVWMHNGFLNVEGEKMSKSLGNFVTINELLKDWPGDVLRFNMLRSHYRQPMDWTVAGMRESWNTLERWYVQAGAGFGPGTISQGFLDALSDDLNTPQAIAELHKSGADDLAGGLMLLGFQPQPERLVSKANVDTDAINALIEARLAARKAKDFKESDRIRDELLAQGIVLKDGPQGTTWEVKK
jgi:cysteinyl-tRNA synthetase